MPFFPGFTDHSPRHINEVLTTASSLISDGSRDLLSSEDAHILALAILLHDCGMHLTQDGFRSVISDESEPICSHFDQKSWNVLWQEFLSEASRFSQQKLESVFGDTNPVDISRFDPSNLSERDLLLAGEFVRRHHARLAHEIALRGVPPFTHGLNIDSVDRDLLGIAGLVARSHNLPVRSSFDYLEERYDIREYRNIKIPYLMGLLRIADYIQVQSERANANLLKVKELRSSISVQEWKAHFAVKHVSTRNEDPEAIFVNVEPENAKTYLKLSALFKDIQRELDETWATLGEVYGRFAPLDTLGLTIRRIRSSLDDVPKLSRRISFVPVRAAFKSSDAELLELLIGPLYGYEPAIGVRELIQNAVDACRELEDLNIDIDTSEQRQQDTDVEIVLKEELGTKTLRVSDRGTGMTPDVVLNYFLVAGASFRNSDVWKERHSDEQGRSRVMRGGRFGVGALAAFLIGKKIRVETRHYSVPDHGGITFEASVGDQIIELRKTSLPIGTTISIEVDEVAWKKLVPRNYAVEHVANQPYDKCSSWEEVNWYGLERPAVRITYEGPRYDYQGEVEEQVARQPKPVLFEGFRVFSDFQAWKDLPNPGEYDRILWSPKPAGSEETGQDSNSKRVKRSPRLTVNGIRIGDEQASWHDYLIDTEQVGEGMLISYERPPLAIFDAAGICPLNLQRSSVNFGDLGIDDQLGAELTDNFLQIVEPHRGTAKTALEALKHIRQIETATYLNFVEHLAGHGNKSLVSPFALTPRGMLLLDPHVLVASRISHLVLVPTHEVSQASPFSLTDLSDDEALVLTRFGDGIQGSLAWFRAMAGFQHYARWFRPRALTGIKTLSSLTAASLETKKLVQQPGRVRRDMLESLEWKSCTGLAQEIVRDAGAEQQTQPGLVRLTRFCKVTNHKGDIAVWRLAAADEKATSRLAERWMKTFPPG